MANLETILGVSAEEFVDSASRAWELGVIIIVSNDDSLPGKARVDELKAGLDRAIEVAVAEGKGDLVREVLICKLVKPSFFDNNIFKTMFFDFVNDFALSDEKLAFLEVGAGTGGIFGGFLRETSERVVGPKFFGRILEKFAK